MLIGLTDFIEIVKIALVLFASGFALLLPLYAYLKDIKLALKICIPFSLSSEVVLGYIFYTSGQIRIFPLIYLLFILLIHLFFAYRLKLFSKIQNLQIRLNWKFALGGLLAIASIIFARFYDAVLNIGPGAIDAAAHAQYVLDLDLYGRLSSTYYAPGFHILIYPLTKVAQMVNIYRFAGPVIGIMVMLTFYFLFKDWLKNKFWAYCLILAFGLPIISILTLETISFFPTILTFIFLPTLIYILTKPSQPDDYKLLVFYVIFMASLALSVPYLLVQLIPAIILLYLIVLFVIKRLGRDYFRLLSKILIVSLLGFLLAFAHVYLQSKISKINNNDSFPQIAIVESEDSGFTTSTNIDKTSILLSHLKWLPENINRSTLVKNYVAPMILTGSDAISIKTIRPLNSLMSIAAYLWILISLIMIYFGIRKKDFISLVLGTMIFVFGVATQTGIFEMSTYRGRSGWYLLLFVLIAAIYFLDMIIKKVPRIISYVVIASLIIVPFIRPPVFYRTYFPEYFSKARELSQQFPNQNLLFISDKPKMTIVSKNFHPLQFVPESLETPCDADQCFVVFAKKFFEVDPVLSQSTLAQDKGQVEFKAQQAIARENHTETVEAIKNYENFTRFEKYWENENISIYRFIK